MEHPCKGCGAYIEPPGPQGKVHCPMVGADITVQGCIYKSAAHPERAQRLIQQAKDRIIRDEWRKAGLGRVPLL